MTIIQLVPGAPPLVNGVGDYAFAVARELRTHMGIDSVFLVCNPTWAGPESHEGFHMVPHALRSASALRRAIAGLQARLLNLRGVLLQLSPYGYDPNGAPFWLLRGLADLKRASLATLPIVTYFHELYATSTPWRRGFWFSPMQRLCAKGILRLSDVALTNTERYAERLAKWGRSEPTPIAAFPVASGIGEPKEVVRLDRRQPQLVIWGSALARRDIYRQRGRTLRTVVCMMHIDRVLDVGVPCDETPAKIGTVGVSRMGVMSPASLSVALSESRLGVISYNPNYLAKSSLFAAFCAHGVPTLVIPTHQLEMRGWDGIQPGTHFVVESDLSEKLSPISGDMSAVLRSALAWYRPHNAAAHAEALARHFMGTPQTSSYRPTNA